MNVNPYITTDYENISNWTLGENKPNSNPIKPNFKKAKMNANVFITKDYRKKDDFKVRINKPNFQNAKNERKLNFNKGLQKKRLFSTPKNKPNSNPIKACFFLDLSIKELIVIFRAYPNNRVVMRPSEKFEAKAAGQKCSEAWFSPRRERFWPTTQASSFAAGRNRAGYSDRLLISCYNQEQS